MRRSSPPFYVLMIAACIGIYAAQLLIGPTLADRFAIFGPAVIDGEVWRVLTGGFLHLHLPHLVMNMLSLYALGALLEPLFAVAARWRFPVLYVASLLGGSLGALLLEYDTPAIGASGAVFGLLGAAIALPLRCGFGINRFNVMPWLALNLVVTFAVPNISAGGHLGGLVVGFLLGWWLTPVGELEDTRALSDPRH